MGSRASKKDKRCIDIVPTHESYLDIIKPGSAIGIIDADLLDNGTRHPNLALMKISSYCKSLGCNVELLQDYSSIVTFDYVFVSKVFSFTKVPDGLSSINNVLVGGTGFFPDGGPSLPSEIEHRMPDYELYSSYVEEKIAEGKKRSWFADYLDYSIGFLSRGCFRKCSFCVNKKYDKAIQHSPVAEFLDDTRPYIYLWDDNFLAFEGWERSLKELEATGKPFQFRQGLDIRLLNKKRAARMSRVRYRGDFIFAFDHIEDKALIEKNLSLWRRHTAKGTRLYVLCAFDSQDEKDIESVFERISILMKYGCLPYIMRYESYKDSPWRSLYVNIARWCNQPQFFKKKSFRNFCYTNQEYHKNKGTLCSALSSMLEFEKAFPDIAKRFFDLRYEEENMLFRYGRPFFGKPTEEVDNLQKRFWSKFANKESDSSALRDYYSKNMDIVWLESYMPEEAPELSEKLFEHIRSVEIEQVFDAVLKVNADEYITPGNIPQYSNIEAVVDVPRILCGTDEVLTYDELGLYLSGGATKAPAANKKFGENHGKLASMLDLASVEKFQSQKGCCKTLFSELFSSLEPDEKRVMVAKLAFRIPVIREIVKDAANKPVCVCDYLGTLSDSTQKRRLPNVLNLLNLIADESNPKGALREALKNVGR